MNNWVSNLIEMINVVFCYLDNVMWQELGSAAGVINGDNYGDNSHKLGYGGVTTMATEALISPWVSMALKNQELGTIPLLRMSLNEIQDNYGF